VLELETALDSVSRHALKDASRPAEAPEVGRAIVAHIESLRGSLEESNSERDSRGARIVSLEQMLRTLYCFVVAGGSKDTVDFATVEESISSSVSADRNRIAEVESALRSIRLLFVDGDVATVDCPGVLEAVSGAVASLRSRLASVEKEDKEKGEFVNELTAALRSIHSVAVGELPTQFSSSAVQESVSAAFEELRSDCGQQKSQVASLLAGFADLSTHILSADTREPSDIVSGVKSAVDGLRSRLSECDAAAKQQSEQISELEVTMAAIGVAVLGESASQKPLELRDGVKAAVEELRADLAEVREAFSVIQKGTGASAATNSAFAAAVVDTFARLRSDIEALEGTKASLERTRLEQTAMIERLKELLATLKGFLTSGIKAVEESGI
jgi:chromosome segregation ATPase